MQIVDRVEPGAAPVLRAVAKWLLEQVVELRERQLGRRLAAGELAVDGDLVGLGVDLDRGHGAVELHVGLAHGAAAVYGRRAS